MCCPLFGGGGNSPTIDDGGVCDPDLVAGTGLIELLLNVLDDGLPPAVF